MKLVVICSPYAGNVEAHVAYARKALRHSLELGEAPFASHLLYPQVADDSDPRERDQAMQAGLEWISVATIVVFYIDCGWSPGMLTELKAARLYARKTELRSLNNQRAEYPL